MNTKLYLLLLAALALATGCTHRRPAGRTVLCIPVYGQSLALGEEALRLTAFDSLCRESRGRIVTQRMDHCYGYFDLDPLKERAKRLLAYDRRSFELSAYAMAQALTSHLGPDTLVCIFPGGQGATPYRGICRGTAPYHRLLSDLRRAHDEAARRGWHFIVPAVCWMHGETDMERRTATDYREAMRRFASDIGRDVRHITGQQEQPRIVTYQTCQLTMAPGFKPHAWHCPEMCVPQAQMELVRDDTLFWASSPVYPFTFAHEGIHLTADGQRQVGLRAAQAVLSMVRGATRQHGLVPARVTGHDSTVVVCMKVPCAPLRFDTVAVAKAPCYGFSVISRTGGDGSSSGQDVSHGGRDIARTAIIRGDSIIIRCSAPVAGCRVRYAVGGEPGTTGPERGPRGNLCDSSTLPNWCFLFDLIVNE